MSSEWVVLWVVFLGGVVLGVSLCSFYRDHRERQTWSKLEQMMDEIDRRVAAAKDQPKP